MAQSAVVEAQQLQHRGAEVVDTDWGTTGIYFLKGVHLLVPHVPLPAPHPPPTADTETAATKGIDAGKTPFPLLFCGYGRHHMYLDFKCSVLSAPSDSGSQSDSSISSDLRPQLSRRNQRGARGRGNDRDRGRGGGERGRGRGGKANRGRR